MRLRTVVAAVIGALLAGTAFVAAAATQHSARTTSIDPSNFVRHVTNPYYPLKPGTLLVYKGVRDGQTQKDRVAVTYRTRVIEGVRTTVERDVATHHARLLERTTDYYAQDKQGNVWYFGEATKAFETQAHQPHPVAVSEAKRGTSDALYGYYTIGKLMILKLRDDYKAKMGPQYSLQKFHDTFISLGPLPLPLIRKAMLGEVGQLF